MENNVTTKKTYSVKDFAKIMGFEVIFDPEKEITLVTPNVNRVGLQLTGYFEYFASDRIQIVGPSEVHYLENLRQSERDAIIDGFFENQFPCVVFSRGLKVDEAFLRNAALHQVAVFRSQLSTSELISDIVENLKDMLAQTVQLHGVLMDIDGVGVFIEGESGIGKSEIALELLRRRHRIVADDIVVIKRIGNVLEGSANERVKHFMELRGVGLVNVVRLYGVEAIKLTQQIELIINLENWDDNKTYERLGGEEEKQNILGVDVLKMTVPVSPGRNIAVVIEAAASVYRLKMMGYNALDELTERLLNN